MKQPVLTRTLTLRTRLAHYRQTPGGQRNEFRITVTANGHHVKRKIKDRLRPSRKLKAEGPMTTNAMSR